MVRFDTLILLQGMKEHQSLPANASLTIKYLHDSSAKVILVGSWNETTNSKFHVGGCLSTKSVAGDNLILLFKDHASFCNSISCNYILSPIY